MKTCTLLFLVKDDLILLAMKKRGFGAGYWNGIGGKIDADETIEAAAIRECQEEIKVTPSNLKKVAEHDFLFPEEVEDILVHAFITDTWEGEPQETDEMAPQWFKLSEIPYANMWEDDSVWLPFVLKSKQVRTTCTFTATNELIDARLTIVDDLR